MSALIRQSHSDNFSPLWAPVVTVYPSQIFTYELPAGVSGGTAPGAFSFYPRPINTAYPPLSDIDNGYSSVIPGMTFDGVNQISLPTGTYNITANVVGLMVTQQARIVDLTNDVVVMTGTSVGAENRNNTSTVIATFTCVGESTIIQIQFGGSQSFGIQDWGQASDVGDKEVYLQCIITKVL